MVVSSLNRQSKVDKSAVNVWQRIALAWRRKQLGTQVSRHIAMSEVQRSAFFPFCFDFLVQCLLNRECIIPRCRLTVEERTVDWHTNSDITIATSEFMCNEWGKAGPPKMLPEAGGANFGSDVRFLGQISANWCPFSPPTSAAEPPSCPF